METRLEAEAVEQQQQAPPPSPPATVYKTLECANGEKAGKQEQQPARPPSPPARYKGVRMRKWGKWVAEVRYPKSRQRLWLGSYPTPEMAAMAYDAAVYCLRGPGEALNFPAHPPNIPSADRLSWYEIREAARQHAQLAKRPSEPRRVRERRVARGRQCRRCRISLTPQCTLVEQTGPELKGVSLGAAVAMTTTTTGICLVISRFGTSTIDSRYAVIFINYLLFMGN